MSTRNSGSRNPGLSQARLKQNLKNPFRFFGILSVFKDLYPHFPLKEIRRHPDNLSKGAHEPWKNKRM